MFTVTETAGARLASTLDRRQAGNNRAMRFVRKRRGWLLSLDRTSSSDVVFTHLGRTVLVLAADAAELLMNRTLDTQESPAGAKLQLR